MNTEKKPWEYGLLHTEKGCPYLLNGDRMFFWLGDTAWLLFSKLNREEMETYLRNRAEKGFTVIQAVAVHHFPAVNVYGQAAFADEEKKLPAGETENGYWELIDFAVRRAAELGMYVGLLPHWGDQREKFTMEQMESYVRFLAGRYGSEPNIIWVTGGDTRGSQGADYWKTMGRLLKERCPAQLVTFHPFGRTSSLDYFPEEDWLDFHMFQSGHRRYDQKVLDAWDDTVKQRAFHTMARITGGMCRMRERPGSRSRRWTRNPLTSTFHRDSIWEISPTGARSRCAATAGGVCWPEAAALPTAIIP